MHYVCVLASQCPLEGTACLNCPWSSLTMLGIAGHYNGPPLISKHLAGRVQVFSGWGGKYLADGWTGRWEAGQGGGRRDEAVARVRAGVPSAYTDPLLTVQVGNNSSSEL